jgi:hypothetical protein
MKSILVLTVILFSTLSFAQKGKKAYSRPYGMAGCGLGSAALGKEGNQVLAATTNGTFYSQLFGITSETLNCVDDNAAQVAHRSDVYIQFNKYALQGDIAQGQGETLAAYSKLVGCSSDEKLGQALKGQFDTIFTNENKNPNEITDAIMSVIMEDKNLSLSCQLG